jgi:hypothetical protein
MEKSKFLNTHDAFGLSKMLQPQTDQQWSAKKTEQ